MAKNRRGPVRLSERFRKRLAFLGHQVGGDLTPALAEMSAVRRTTSARLGESKRAGSTVVRFDDASHAGGFTRYASRFVMLIEQAVAATVG